MNYFEEKYLYANDWLADFRDNIKTKKVLKLKFNYIAIMSQN